MAFQTVFKRYELKYMMTYEQKQLILEEIAPFMVLDEYGRTTIRNIYFDTDSGGNSAIDTEAGYSYSGGSFGSQNLPIYFIKLKRLSQFSHLRQPLFYAKSLFNTSARGRKAMAIPAHRTVKIGQICPRILNGISL